MSERRQLEFFLLRYVPDAVKGEFVNIGVVMLEEGANGSGFADVRFIRDWRRVRCLDPGLDTEIFEALEREVRAALSEAGDRETLIRRMQDSFSNLIQLSGTKGYLAEDPASEIATMARMYLEAPMPRVARGEASERQRIFRSMRKAFEVAGVWDLLTQQIGVQQYTRVGDPFVIDCGYRPNGELKMFHAVPLMGSVEPAMSLAFRYPRIVAGMAGEDITAKLTAVVEDDLDRNDSEVKFALGSLEETGVQIAAAAEMPVYAERARIELHA